MPCQKASNRRRVDPEQAGSIRAGFLTRIDQADNFLLGSWLDYPTPVGQIMTRLSFVHNQEICLNADHLASRLFNLRV